jgi:hypothetical protein
MDHPGSVRVRTYTCLEGILIYPILIYPILIYPILTQPIATLPIRRDLTGSTLRNSCANIAYRLRRTLTIVRTAGSRGGFPDDAGKRQRPLELEYKRLK